MSRRGQQAGPLAEPDETVTISFAQTTGPVCVLAQLRIGDHGQARALAVLMDPSEPAAASVRDGLKPEGQPWRDVAAGGLQVRVEEPDRLWRASLKADEVSWDVALRALGEPARLTEDSELVRAGGLAGQEHFCAVEGTLIRSGRRQRLAGLGQLGWTRGRLDPARVALTRTISAWIGGDRALLLSAVRPATATNQGAEATAAFLVADGGPAPAGRLAAQLLDEARLSTTYDVEGRQHRAGLELWRSPESELPERLTGELLCQTALELTPGRLQSAFFRWRMDGREGLGRYDLLVTQ